MKVEAFFDKLTFTVTYLVFDEETKDAVIIDPVLDFDAASGQIEKVSFNILKNFIKNNELNPIYVMETHVHADHLSSSNIIKEHYPNIKSVISEQIKTVQEVFNPIFNMSNNPSDGSQFDILLKDGQELKAGSIAITAFATPGHTPACMSFKIGNALFTGDAIFMPDMGTGRCDFPKGSAIDLYESIQKIYGLPDETLIYVGHDYAPNGREYTWQTTIGVQKASNIQLKAQTSKDEFIDFRTKRDATLNAPKLLLPSIQVNINAGKLPCAENNGLKYLKIPIKE